METAYLWETNTLVTPLIGVTSVFGNPKICQVCRENTDL
jgi:hypothetical protein